jgi:diaminopimelate decarboxylase
MESRDMSYDWEQLNALLEDAGGAIYIAKPDVFVRNVENMLGAFRQFYQNTQLGYSYKTSYLPALCIEADRRGLYAEVVSGMEYDMALALGVPHERIIFNGPAKHMKEVSKALLGGARLNVDSLHEVELIREVAARHPDLTVAVGLRCNLDMQWKGRTSRFGLSDANGDLQLAGKLLRELPNITLSGLHCHFSFDRSADSYRQRAGCMLQLARQLFTDYPPQYLDLGGGFFGPMPESLREQFSVDPPGYADYAEAIAPQFLHEYGAEDGPELILEPGIGLVADTMEYACRVDTLKQMPGRRVAVTHGTVEHLKIVPNEINQPVSILRPHSSQGAIADCSAEGQPIDMVGFTCLEHDVLFRNYYGPLSAGDIALFSSVGAYSFVTAPPFIRTTPPIVMRDGGGWKTLMKKAQVSQLLSAFSL